MAATPGADGGGSFSDLCLDFLSFLCFFSFFDFFSFLSDLCRLRSEPLSDDDSPMNRWAVVIA